MLNFKQSILKYATGNLPSDQLPGVAIIGMQEGYDSPALLILAGLAKSEESYVVQRYFQLALSELGIVMPLRRSAALQYAHVIAGQVINGGKDVVDGIAEMHYNSLSKYDFMAENKNYVYDSIFFENLYGLLDTFDELTDNETSFNKDKAEKELVKIREEMLVELEIWVYRISPYLV